jgi:hypothetical protein
MSNVEFLKLDNTKLKNQQKEKENDDCGLYLTTTIYE